MSTGTAKDPTPALGVAVVDRTVTDQRLDRLADYLHELLAAMGLGEWNLRLKLDQRPDAEGAIAQVLPVKNRSQAVLRFAEDFFTLTPEEQRHTCTHELAHLVTNGITDAAIDDAFRGVIGRAVHDVFYANLALQEERAVDRFAEIIAPFMPLPDLDGKKKPAKS